MGKYDYDYKNREYKHDENESLSDRQTRHSLECRRRNWNKDAVDSYYRSLRKK